MAGKKKKDHPPFSLRVIACQGCTAGAAQHYWQVREKLKDIEGRFRNVLESDIGPDGKPDILTDRQRERITKMLEAIVQSSETIFERARELQDIAAEINHLRPDSKPIIHGQ